MDEILVHITAPTTRKNDDIYRSLAESYHDFEAAGVEGTLGGKTSVSFSTSIQPNHASAEYGLHQSQAYSKGSQSFVSKDSYGSFPSFTPPGSPNDAIPSSSDDSLRSSNESNKDSSRLAQLERIQRTWKQRTIRKGRTPVSSKSDISFNDLTAQDATFIEDSQLAAQAIHSQLSDDLSQSSDGFSDDDFGNVLHSTVRPGSPSVDQTSSPEKDASNELAMTVALSEPHSPVSANSSDQEAIDRIANEALPYPLDFGRLPLEVYPPPPKISINAPGKLPSQMTEMLRNTPHRGLCRTLAKKLRTLLPDERGCWVFNTDSWVAQSQYHFWVHLSKFISEGKLGWGLSLFREPKVSDGKNIGLGEVRLYCWGEIVEEIWGIMYKCSLNELVRSGSKWLDADGIAVMELG